MVVNQAQLAAMEEAKAAALAGESETREFTPLEIDGPTGWQQLLTTRRRILQPGCVSSAQISMLGCSEP
jgi:hypothetical protein